MIFDSYYDSYKGVIVYIRIKQGKVKVGDTIRMMASGACFTVVELGYMGAKTPSPPKSSPPGKWATLPLPLRTSPIPQWATP